MGSEGGIPAVTSVQSTSMTPAQPTRDFSSLPYEIRHRILQGVIKPQVPRHDIASLYPSAWTGFTDDIHGLLRLRNRIIDEPIRVIINECIRMLGAVKSALEGLEDELGQSVNARQFVEDYLGCACFSCTHHHIHPVRQATGRETKLLDFINDYITTWLSDCTSWCMNDGYYDGLEDTCIGCALHK